MRVTLKDIAARTGYTANTVSRALKDKEDIGAETRKSIQEIAREMGYISDSLAAALRTGQSGAIAVVLGDISNPHFAIIAREIELSARKQHYSTMILNSDEDAKIESEALRLALSRKVDGIIICPTQWNRENLEFLCRQQAPFVLIGRHFPGAEVESVVCDDFKGGQLAAEHLLARGHRRILFLNGPSHISSAIERVAGYRVALAQAGVPCDPRLEREIPIVAGDCRHVIYRVLDEGVDFTAIIAFSDLIAWEAMYALQKRGLENPRDYAIVGFDNIQSKFFFPFSLTSVGASRTNMARRAFHQLLQRLNTGTEPKVWKTVLDITLVVRESSSTVVAPVRESNRSLSPPGSAEPVWKA
jgi:LacI family transcriptional regulator